MSKPRRTIKHIKKDIQSANRQIEFWVDHKNRLKEELNKAEGRRFFIFPTGERIPFNKITLYRSWWIETGLGYSDDVVHFGEYSLGAEGVKCYARLSSQKIREEMGVPLEPLRYGGFTPKLVGKEHPFASKFKEIIDWPVEYKPTNAVYM